MMTLNLPRRHLIAGGIAIAAAGRAATAPSARAPARWGATPSARQLAWHRRERYGFVHLSINTFTDREWGYGDEAPKLFDPNAFDSNQIVAAAKSGGLTGLVLTSKYHDGFCLWPTPLTKYCIRNSPYKNGKGDIVRELGDACCRAGLFYGLYLSPWDRNRTDYGAPTYIDYFRSQLTDLCTSYGELFEVWFDGANGGDGYYGGARGAPLWWPAESNTCIRPSWFYHAGEDMHVKSPARLMQFHDESVGRGTSMMLDLPPGRRFDLIRIREALALGVRITRFAVDVAGADGQWREVANRECIGAQRIIRLPAPVSPRRVRLRIVEAPICPAITEVSLFLSVAPAAIPAAQATRCDAADEFRARHARALPAAVLPASCDRPAARGYIGHRRVPTLIR